MDTVFIQGLQLPTIIGVYNWEREQPQTLLLDIQLAWDNAKAAQQDDINQALDYAKVAETVCKFAKQQQFQLLESLVESIASLLMKEFNVYWLKLTLVKPGILANAKNVGVTIERGTSA